MFNKLYKIVLQRWRISLLFFSIIILLMIIFLDYFTNATDFSIWNYIQGGTTEFLGIVLTVILVNYLYDCFRIKKLKNDENIKIKNLNLILKPCIEKTYLSTVQLYCEDFSATQQFDISKYKFRDLKHAFGINTLMDEGFKTKAYEVYYKNHKILIEKIERIFAEQEFEFNTEYIKLLESFLTDSMFDYENEKGIIILDINKEKMLPLFLDSDTCPELLKSNLRNYLIYLYKSSQRFYRFILDYNNFIKEI